MNCVSFLKIDVVNSSRFPGLTVLFRVIAVLTLLLCSVERSAGQCLGCGQGNGKTFLLAWWASTNNTHNVGSGGQVVITWKYNGQTKSVTKYFTGQSGHGVVGQVPIGSLVTITGTKFGGGGQSSDGICVGLTSINLGQAFGFGSAKKVFGPCDLSKPGAASSANGSVQFSLGLGQSSRAESYGNITYEQNDLSSGTAYEPSALNYFAQPLCEKITVDGDPESPLKQVLTPQVLVHVENISGGFEVRFFAREKVQGKVGLTYTVNGGYALENSTVTWRVSNPGFDEQDRQRLELTEIRPLPGGGQSSKVTRWTQGEPGSDSYWEKNDDDGARIEQKWVQHWSEDGDMTVTRVVMDSNYEVVSESLDNFVKGNLVWHREGPENGGEWVQYQYFYTDEDGDGVAETPELEWMKRSDGYWEKYGRAVMSGDTEQTPYVVKPYGDLTFNYGTPGSGAVTWVKHDYATTTTIECINGIEVGRVSVTDYEILIPNSPNSDIPVRGTQTLRYRDSTRIWYDYSEVQTYGETAPAHLAGRAYSELNAAGLRKSYTYEIGSIDAAGNFTANTNGTYVRQTMTEAAENIGSIVGRSRREVTIYDAMERAIVEEDYLCTGSGTFSFLSRTMHQFDGEDRLTATSRDGRPIYQAHYNAEGRMEWEIDETGIKTITLSWDWAGRPTLVKREGFAGAGATAPKQFASFQASAYDLEGRLASDEILAESDDVELYTRRWIYDTAGRLMSESNKGVTTSYAYSVDANTGAGIVTKTLPGNSTEVTTNYVDGRVKSISGTAVVATAYSYGVNPANGTLWEKIERGVSQPGAAGAVWKTTTKDWVGRTLAEQLARPGGGQPDTITRTFTYSEDGQENVSNSPWKEFVNGHLVSQSTVNIAAGSETKIVWLSETESFVTTRVRTVELLGGVWYVVEISPNGTRKEQVSGFGSVAGYGWLTGHNIELNAASDKTETFTYTDPSNKLVRERSNRNGASIIAERLIRNGVLESETTYSISTPKVYYYDDFGRLARSTDPATGAVTFTTYASIWSNEVESMTTLSASETDPTAGQSQSVTYTYYGQNEASPGKLKSRTENGKVTYYGYTARGELARVWGDTYPLQYRYDTLGRIAELHTYRTAPPDPSASTWPDGDKTTWGYHVGTDAIASKTDALNRSVTYSYDEFGNMDVRTWARPVGNQPLTTDYDYDWKGQLKKIQYGDAGATPTVVWSLPDSKGRYTQLVDGAGIHTLSYDVRGRLQGDAVAAGGILGNVTSSMTSGVFGREESLGISLNGTAVVQQSYEYEPSTGRFWKAKNLKQNIEGTYVYLPQSDRVGEVLTKASAVDRLKIVRTPDGFGRLWKLEATSAGSLVDSHTYSYNGKELREYDTQANGERWNYTYNTRDEVTRGRKELSATTGVLGAEFEYNYDAIGNRISTATNSRPMASYTPNKLNQYASRDVPSVFDIAGTAASTAVVKVNGTTAARQGQRYLGVVSIDNALSPVWAPVAVKAYLAGDPNDSVKTLPDGSVQQHRFVPQTPETFQYDLDGNLIQDGRWTYTWDAENRLVGIETRIDVSQSVTIPRLKLRFTYDALNRRIQKEVFRWSGSGYLSEYSERYVYVPAGWNLLAAIGGSTNNSLKQSYLWGVDLSGSLDGAGGIGGLLSVYDTDTAKSYLPVCDANGNQNVLIDASSGVVVARCEYGPFGELYSQTGVASGVNPFRFSSKYTDRETSLIYYGHRYYSSEIGRWLSRDPLLENRFSMTPAGAVSQSPTSTTDIASYTLVGNSPVNRVDFLGLLRVDPKLEARWPKAARRIRSLGDRLTINKIKYMRYYGMCCPIAFEHGREYIKSKLRDGEGPMVDVRWLTGARAGYWSNEDEISIHREYMDKWEAGKLPLVWLDMRLEHEFVHHLEYKYKSPNQARPFQRCLPAFNPPKGVKTYDWHPATEYVKTVYGFDTVGE